MRGALFACVLASTLSGCLDDRAVERPNIVLIIIDTLRGDRLGCAGFPDGVSPEIDALSRRGLYFGRTVAACTWTRPSVGSMLTSLTPRSLGLYREKGEALPDRARTMAEILHENGYRTLGVTANPILNAYYNFHQGFDVYVDSRFLFPYMETQGADPDERETATRSAREVLGEAVRQLDASPAPEVGPVAPWFVMVNLLDVHEHSNTASHVLRRGFAGLYPDAPNGEYLRAVRQVSWDIGRFVRTLRDRPGWERTLVIVTSDHGEGLNDHPEVTRSTGHGLVLYESNAIVPLILNATPTRWEPRTTDRLVGLVDLLPTVLDAVGVPVPRQAIGSSLLTGDGEGEYVTESRYRGTHKVGLYGEDWKLFRQAGRFQEGLGSWELQRSWQTADGEQTDSSAAHPELAATLRRQLREWEKSNPSRRATVPAEPIDDELLEQLRAVGYLDSPGAP